MASACGALAGGGAWRKAAAGCLKGAAGLIAWVSVSMARDLRFPEPWVAAGSHPENSDNVPKGYPGGGDGDPGGWERRRFPLICPAGRALNGGICEVRRS